MNATIAKVTPIMTQNITYGTYFFFGACAVLMGAFTYLFVPETRGRSLEEMEKVNTIVLVMTPSSSNVSGVFWQSLGLQGQVRLAS